MEKISYEEALSKVADEVAGVVNKAFAMKGNGVLEHLGGLALLNASAEFSETATAVIAVVFGIDESRVDSDIAAKLAEAVYMRKEGEE